MKTNEEYNHLAENYRTYKNKSLINIFRCGKVLYSAKKELPKGMFNVFLSDSRVKESVRTSQRLISIYKNFRHLVDHERKMAPLSGLGVTALIELQRLPDRFRKDIEIKEGEYITVVKVMDEDKISDFLDKSIQYNGKQIHIRDLQVADIKKQILEERGEVKGSQVADFNDELQNDVVVIPPTNNDIISGLNQITRDLLLSGKYIEEIDTIDTGKRSAILDTLGKIISAAEAIIVKCDNLRDKI